MIDRLPRWILRSPQAFYVAAVLMFFAYSTLGFYDVQEAAFQYGSGEAVQLATLRVLLDSIREALYLLGTGVWLHVMLAIWYHIVRFEPEAAA